MSESWNDQSSEKLKQQIRAIGRTSNSAEEIKQRMKDELSCPYTPAVNYHSVQTQSEQEARDIVGKLGGIISDSAMVMVMVWHRGEILNA